ncbi:MAG: DUF4055 domain-containing protein [Gammaproteobacteria bacterium]|jgi:hypothetical protein|nr:DUF4055 domain-containing protein [Gammaproteobacteria bacterium]
MPVNDPNAEYRKNLDGWTLVSDCIEGAKEVKSKGTTYLPKPNPNDTSAENTDRYNTYKERANFVNFTGHTKTGLLGLVFRKDTDGDLPQAIEYLFENANGSGLTLDQLTRDVIGETLEAGRYGLLVDYPTAAGAVTRADEVALNLRANILAYQAKSVINWRTEMIGGVKKLSLVVLLEQNEVIAADGFMSQVEDQYRVLRLTDGYYTVQTYNKDGEAITEEIEPRKSDGGRWDTIPFAFVGAQNNDESVDKAPLIDIAEVNVAHYRNSADYEDSSFMVGQPTPFVTGLSQSWVDGVLKGGVVIGSRQMLLLPEGGNAGLIQANPNQMPERGMEMKEAQMVMLGARLIMDNKGVETAEAARIRYSGQNSLLGLVVGNSESALIQCMGWAGEFMGSSEEVTYKINREFYDATIDPQSIMAQIQLVDRGVIADTDLRTNLRKGGLIEAGRTDEDIEGEAEDITGF